jgi:uncharacterized protein (UPF0335 family)
LRSDRERLLDILEAIERIENDLPELAAPVRAILEETA